MQAKKQKPVSNEHQLGVNHKKIFALSFRTLHIIDFALLHIHNLNAY